MEDKTCTICTSPCVTHPYSNIVCLACITPAIDADLKYQPISTQYTLMESICPYAIEKTCSHCGHSSPFMFDVFLCDEHIHELRKLNTLFNSTANISDYNEHCIYASDSEDKD